MLFCQLSKRVECATTHKVEDNTYNIVGKRAELAVAYRLVGNATDKDGTNILDIPVYTHTYITLYLLMLKETDTVASSRPAKSQYWLRAIFVSSFQTKR